MAVISLLVVLFVCVGHCLCSQKVSISCDLQADGQWCCKCSQGGIGMNVKDLHGFMLMCNDKKQLGFIKTFSPVSHKSSKHKETTTSSASTTHSHGLHSKSHVLHPLSHTSHPISHQSTAFVHTSHSLLHSKDHMPNPHVHTKYSQVLTHPIFHPPRSNVHSSHHAQKKLTIHKKFRPELDKGNPGVKVVKVYKKGHHHHHSGIHKITVEGKTIYGMYLPNGKFKVIEHYKPGNKKSKNFKLEFLPKHDILAERLSARKRDCFQHDVHLADGHRMRIMGYIWECKHGVLVKTNHQAMHYIY